MRDSIELSHAIPADVDPLGYFDLFGIRFLRVIPMAGKCLMRKIKQTHVHYFTHVHGT